MCGAAPHIAEGRKTLRQWICRCVASWRELITCLVKFTIGGGNVWLVSQSEAILPRNSKMANRKTRAGKQTGKKSSYQPPKVVELPENMNEGGQGGNKPAEEVAAGHSVTENQQVEIATGEEHANEGNVANAASSAAEYFEGGDGDMDLDLEDELDREMQEDVWTYEKEDKLIDLYEKCVFLYDKASPGFQLRHKKDLAFRKIAAILGIPGEYLLDV